MIGVLEVRQFPIRDLQPYYRNPRRGDVSAIAESLNVRGQYRPIVVNVGTHTGRPFEILAGNHTWLAARQLKWPTIQATTVDVTDDEAAQIVVADNRLADLGDYDQDVLAQVIAGIESPVGLGFTAAEVARMVAGAGDEPVALTEVDEVDDFVPEEPVSRLGDVWRLGPHLLWCGRAEDTAGLARVLLDAGNIVPDAVWTDPPYGVNYVGGTKDALTIQNDSMEFMPALLTGMLRTIATVCRPGAPVYVAHADTIRVLLEGAMRAEGLLLRQNLIWVKDSLVLGRADYHYRHEPVLVGSVAEDPDAPAPDPVNGQHQGVLYGFVPGARGRLGRGGPQWYGDHKQTTVFQIGKPKRNDAHPTMKPVELVRAQLQNSLPAGGVVLDLFGGSGSTMIAAHHLKASSVLVELDPRYVDAICRRWEQHTGVVPVRDSTGEEVSFATT